MIGFLLDLEIRKATNNARSLDDLMTQAYARYSGAKGFTSAEFRSLASEVAGVDLSAWFRTALDTTDELAYDHLGWLGLRFRPEPASTKAWVGLTTVMPGATLRNDNGRLVVAQVRRGTPVFDAGVNAEDEILAIGGYRVRPDQWEARLDAFKPGDKVPLLVARREQLLTLEVTPAAEPPRAWRLEPARGSPQSRKSTSGGLVEAVATRPLCAQTLVTRSAAADADRSGWRAGPAPSRPQGPSRPAGGDDAQHRRIRRARPDQQARRHAAKRDPACQAEPGANQQQPTAPGP